MLSRLLHPLAAAAGGAPGGAGGAVSTSTTSSAAAAATAAAAAASGGVYRGTLTVMSLEHVPMEAASLVVEAAVSPPRASVGPSGGVTAVATVARHAAVWDKTFPLAVRLPPAPRASRHDRPSGSSGAGSAPHPVLRLAVRRAGGAAGGGGKRGNGGGGGAAATAETADLGVVELDLQELAHGGGDAASLAAAGAPPASPPGVATINRKFLLLRSSINATLRVAVSLAPAPAAARRWGRRPAREPAAALPAAPRSAAAAAASQRSLAASRAVASTGGPLPALWLPPTAHSVTACPTAAACVAPPRVPARYVGGHRRVRSLTHSPPTQDPLVESRRPRTRGTTPAGSAAPSIGSSDTDREALVGSGAGAPAPLGASPSLAPSAAAVAAAAAARRRRARTKALSGMAAGGGGGYSAFLPAAGLRVTGVSASDPGLSPSHSSVDAQSLAYLSTTSSSCGSGGVAVAVDGADTLSAALGLGRGEAGIFDADSARSGSGRCDRAGIDGHLPRAVAASRVDAAETVAAVVATGVAKAAARHSAGGVGEWEWLAAMQERVSDAFEEERMVMSRSPYGWGGGGGGGSGGDDSGRQSGGDTVGRGAAVPLRGDRRPLVVAEGGS